MRGPLGGSPAGHDFRDTPAGLRLFAEHLHDTVPAVGGSKEDRCDLGQAGAMKAGPRPRVSDFGSGIGSGDPASAAVRRRQTRRVDAMSTRLTCGNAPEQGFCKPQRLVRDEEAAGSNPATPTTKLQVTAIFRDEFRLPIPAVSRFWERTRVGLVQPTSLTSGNAPFYREARGSGGIRRADSASGATSPRAHRISTHIAFACADSSHWHGEAQAPTSPPLPVTRRGRAALPGRARSPETRERHRVPARACQFGGRSPAMVRVTSRRIASADGRVPAAVRACRQ
jgi:hypothetical protein